MTTLYQQTKPMVESARLHKNNFDLLRLLFAGTVCLVHTCTLSGFPELGWIEHILSSTVAVKSFFVISGFLIFMSCERSNSMAVYAGKRVRRIYPAYFTVVTLCAFGLVMVSAKAPHEYFSAHWLQYLAANLSFLNFLQLSLPGVFEANKLTYVNGALWTLKIEVMFYLSVPFFVFLFRKFGRPAVMALTYCASIAYAALMADAAQRTGSSLYLELGRQLPGQLAYFISGAFLYYFRPFFERYVEYFVIPAFSVLVLNHLYPLTAVEPFALAVIVVYFGLFLYLGNFGKYGDFSYGVYILHFPIIQLLLSSGFFKNGPWSLLFSTLILTGFSAVCLWHLVEKRFLFRNNHYVETSTSKARVSLPAKPSKQDLLPANRCGS